eukprot:jgi/Hompol1/1472/HPOL_000348-RA
MTYPTLKFTYFGIRARGELARLTLHIGGIPFEDERIEFKDWPASKSSTPFGQLPVLTIDGKIHLTQSLGIARYAGSLCGLYPAADPLKAALVDQVVFHVEDMMNSVSFTNREKDAERKTAMRKVLAEEKLPAMYAALDKVIQQFGNGKYAVGDSLTIADIYIYVYRAIIRGGWWDNIPGNLADSHPHVTAVCETVAAHPRVVEWEATHSNK